MAVKQAGSSLLQKGPGVGEWNPEWRHGSGAALCESHRMKLWLQLGILGLLRSLLRVQCL